MAPAGDAGSSAAHLAPYVRALIEAARREGLSYLELRGSPQKYRDSREGQLDFLRRLKETAEAYDDLELRFIVIADRRQPEAAAAAVDLAITAREALDGFVVAFDLTGDEKQDDVRALKKLAERFQPAFEGCLPVTVHAGVGSPAEKIWEAAYLLHADRVGHGLTLAQNPQLLQRFRDRDICLELCPTSNFSRRMNGKS